jgi:predicted permease
MGKVDYILQSVFPVFIVLGIGYFLAKIGFISDRFKSDLSSYVFYVALPILFFTNISQADIYSSFDKELLIFSIITVCVTFITTQLVILYIPINNENKGPFVQGSFRGNLAYVGLPIVLNAFGKEVLPVVGIYIALIAPLFNLFAVISLTSTSHFLEKKVNIRRMGRVIITNPLVISCTAGICIAIMSRPFGGITYPPVIEKSLNLIAQTTAPLALICVGASLEFKSRGTLFLLTIIVSIIKLVLMPLLGFSLYKLFNTSQRTIGLGTILLATPTAVASHIMTKTIGGNEKFSASIVFFTHIISIVTIPFWLFFVS